MLQTAGTRCGWACSALKAVVATVAAQANASLMHFWHAAQAQHDTLTAAGTPPLACGAALTSPVKKSSTSLKQVLQRVLRFSHGASVAAAHAVASQCQQLLANVQQVRKCARQARALVPARIVPL